MCLNNKQEGKLLLNLELVQGTVTKVANELSSWSLSCVEISWRWPHVKYI